MDFHYVDASSCTSARTWLTEPNQTKNTNIRHRNPPITWNLKLGQSRTFFLQSYSSALRQPYRTAGFEAKLWGQQMAAGWAVSQCVCRVDITVISAMKGQLSDPVLKEHMKRASEGSAPMLTVQWIINTTNGHGALVFGLASTPVTDTYEYTLTHLTLPPGQQCVCMCAVLPSDSSSSLFSLSLFLPLSLFTPLRLFNT